MILRIVLIAVNVIALIVVVILYRRVRSSEKKKRRIEAPNSEHRSRYLEDVEAKERWKALDLDRMHPVNRGEVERVLNKLRATSVRALTAAERGFLDRMVEAERRSGGRAARATPWSAAGGPDGGAVRPNQA